MTVLNEGLPNERQQLAGQVVVDELLVGQSSMKGYRTNGSNAAGRDTDDYGTLSLMKGYRTNGSNPELPKRLQAAHSSMKGYRTNGSNLEIAPQRPPTYLAPQ